MDKKFKSPFALVGVGSPTPLAGRHSTLEAVGEEGAGSLGRDRTQSEVGHPATARTGLTSPRLSAWP